MSEKDTWMVRTAGEVYYVPASDQWEAYGVLRFTPLDNLGAMVTACPASHDGDDEHTYAVRTALLLHNWGRPREAMELTAFLVREEGLPLETARQCPEWDEALWRESEAKG